jgi:HAD superfamily hydrolase (TIGR01509 family)
VIRAVAWDIDGTLVDSEGLHHVALVEVSARHGVRIAPDDARFVGVSMDRVWHELASLYPATLSEAAWMQQICASYLHHAPRLRAIPGALEALAELRDAGVRQCCVSNSVRAIVDRNLQIIGAAAYLEFSISRDDVACGKPDPAPYRLACERLALAPDEVLVVEDSGTGVAAGRAAGCRVMRVGHGECDFAAIVAAVVQPAGVGA